MSPSTANAVVDLADEQAIDAGLAAAAPGGYDKLLTLVGHSLFATPAEVRRPAYAQLAGHAIDGKLTVDLEQTRLEDISGTWEHLKTGAPRKLVVTP